MVKRASDERIGHVFTVPVETHRDSDDLLRLRQSKKRRRKLLLQLITVFDQDDDDDHDHVVIFRDLNSYEACSTCVEVNKWVPPLQKMPHHAHVS
jgi:hypothetical protein